MSTTAKSKWLLVEWIDKKKTTPSYGTVNSNKLKNEESEPLRPGKILLKCPKHNTSRRAKILLVSESKRHCKDQKKLLKSQDKQIKKAQKRKAEEDPLDLEQPTSSSDIPIPDVMDSQNHSDCDSQFDAEQPSSSSEFPISDVTDPYDYSDSDSEVDDEVALNLSIKDKTSNFNKSTPPLSSSSAEDNVDLLSGQGPEPEIKELQGGGKIVSKSLDNLEPQLNVMNSENATSTSEHNNGPSHIVQIEPNNGEESHSGEQQKNSSPKVRQMSAQNTDNKENVNDVHTFDAEQPSSSSEFPISDVTDPYDYSDSDSEVDDEVALNLSIKDKTSNFNKSTPPLSSSSAEDNVDLLSGQGPEPEIKELQGGGKIVSKSLDNLEPQLNVMNSENATSTSEHNNGPSHIVQIEPNNGEESHSGEQQKNSSPKVRQMSAQNTDNKENVNDVHTVTIVHYV